MSRRLAQLRQQFNTERAECPCCSIERYADVEEYRAAQELTGAANRLDKVCDYLLSR